MSSCSESRLSTLDADLTQQCFLDGSWISQTLLRWLCIRRRIAYVYLSFDMDFQAIEEQRLPAQAYWPSCSQSAGKLVTRHTVI